MNKELLEAYIAERMQLNRIRLERSELGISSAISYSGALYELEALRRFMDTMEMEVRDGLQDNAHS